MKIKFHRKSVKIIDWFLKTVGVNVHQRNIPLKKFYQFVGIIPPISSFFSISYYIFKKRKHADEAIIAAAYIGAVIIMISAVIILLRNRSKILNLLKMIDNNVYRYPDEKNIDFEIRGWLNEKYSFIALIIILGYECFGFSLSAISPLIGFLITGVYQTLMFPSSYPWNEEETVSLLATNFFQIIGVIGAFWIFYVIQVLVTSLTIEFLRQYERLGTALLTIQERSECTVLDSLKTNSVHVNVAYARVEENFRQLYGGVYRQNIRHCIKHHQQLWRLFHLFEPWFSLLFSIELAISVSTFAMVFYNLLTTWNPETFLTIIGSSFNVMANFFSRCVIGEIFAEMNEKIADTIFHEMNWCEQSTQNRRLLVFFHMTSKRSYNLVGFSVFSASYFTFSHILRISYSFFNIIRSSFSNK